MYNIKDYIHTASKGPMKCLMMLCFLQKKNRWKSCVNRLYYSCFQLIDALLYMENLQIKTHSGLKNSFFQYYIKTGIIDKEFGKLYDKLFDWRNEGDYAVFIEFEKEDVTPLIPQVKNFLDAMQNLIIK